MLQGEYVKDCSSSRLLANDAYLQMAIGNTLWSIGVTVIDIHARTSKDFSPEFTPEVFCELESLLQPGIANPATHRTPKTRP
ncbi:pre-mRNA-splicing factor 18 isoform 1-T3 [Molossus nigricans]